MAQQLVLPGFAWSEEELRFLDDLQHGLRQRVRDRAMTDGIAPTAAYELIAREDLSDAIEDRARNHRN